MMLAYAAEEIPDKKKTIKDGLANRLATVLCYSEYHFLTLHLFNPSKSSNYILR
jgi:hypothetical protein